MGLPPHPQEPIDGLQALEEMIAWNPAARVIVTSGNSERRNMLAAVVKGAYDIFLKPFDMDGLKAVLHHIYRRIDFERESYERRNLCQPLPFEGIIGSSPVMQEIFATARKVAATDIPILITGESGTGKELLAKAIHNRSSRTDGPFIAIDCGALPEPLIESELFGHEKGSFTGATVRRKGKLESSDGGTLFLNDIEELVPEVQIKILRLLQDKTIERLGGTQPILVDTRVIAATSQNLEDQLKEAHFRKELYFGLAVVKMALPPLRERGNDVIQLAEHLVVEFSK
jgi:two-component system NtrC family response regulator